MAEVNRQLPNLVPVMKHMREFNFRLIARLAGMLMVVMAAAMALPIIASIYYGDGEQFDLLLSAILMMVIGLFARNILGRRARALPPHAVMLYAASNEYNCILIR